MSRVTVSLILVLLLAEPAVGGQEVGAVPAAGIDLPFPIDGPPPPVPPAVVARDASGRVTVRAVRLTAPLRIDGRLDEEVYATVPAMSDFIQNDPVEGAPTTQKTEVWVFFDDDHVYVVGRCWESNLERMIATEMRRDGAIPRNDNFAWSFDTFYDRRNAILFEVSPLGGRIDAQVTNERQISANWNPVWKLDVGRFDGGWTVEAALPFKSLRYRPGRAQIWGFQARRKNLWKNEMSFLTPVPRAVAGQGHFRSSLSATLVGLGVKPIPSWNSPQLLIAYAALFFDGVVSIFSSRFNASRSLGRYR